MNSEDDELTRIGRAYRSARTRVKTLHAELEAAVIEAYRNGDATMDIARRAHTDRETVRRIRNAAEEAGRLPRRPIKV